jgi:hypothetical protein
MFAFPTTAVWTIIIVQVMLVKSLLLLPMNLWSDLFTELDEVKKN